MAIADFSNCKYNKKYASQAQNPKLNAIFLTLKAKDTLRSCNSTPTHSLSMLSHVRKKNAGTLLLKDSHI